MADDPRLLVPVALDVLVVNRPLHNSNVPFARWAPRYANWATYDPPVHPGSDATQLGRPAIGVHLKWALPDALTRGRLSPDGSQFDFPLIPNRWLVTRLTPAADPAAAPSSRSWLVESDTITEPPDPHASAYLRPGVTITPENIGANTVFIGRVNPLEAVTQAQVDAGAGVAAFLTAVGPGDPAFAAYQPAVATVLSFHDDLADLTDPSAGTTVGLTYVLAGWHHRAGDDPLAEITTFADGGAWPDEKTWAAATPQERLVTLLERYEWSIGSADTPASPPPDAPVETSATGPAALSATPPTTTLYHSVAYSVQWQQSTIPPSPNGGPADWPARLQVAVGSTSVEALGALVDAHAVAAGLDDIGAYLAELLEAAEYREMALADARNGWTKINRRVHDAHFGGQPGGIVWRVVPLDAEKNDDGPALPDTVQLWLDALNAAQRALDAAQRDLARAQRDLYGLWWKNGKAHAPFADLSWPIAALATALPTASVAVAAHLDRVSALANAVPADPSDRLLIDDWVAAHAPAGGLPAGLQLRSGAMPRFWSPNDPVILVAGIQRSLSHGADTRSSDDDTLAVRLSGTTVTGIEFAGTSIALPAGSITIPAGPGMPGLSWLHVEAAYVDPANAIRLAAACGRAGDATFINDLATAIGSGLTAPDRWDGTPPAALGLAAWSQPFVPLYLDWSVQFTPTYHPAADGQSWTYDPSAWTFDGREYQYAGGSPLPATYTTYSGRTPLSNHAGDQLVDAITTFLTSPPQEEGPDVARLLATLDEPHLLSQSLSGLTRRLTMWIEEQNVPPFGTDATTDRRWADLIGQQFHAAPDVGAGAVARVPSRTITPYFFPIRAGLLTFSSLGIIDVFGQRVDLLYGNGNPSAATDPVAGFVPIAGPSVAAITGTPPLPGAAILRPRFASPARLDITLAPPSDHPTMSTTGEAPVGPSTPGDGLCGWLVPNHVDFGVSVYGADGEALGELFAAPGPSGTTSVVWQPAPGGAGLQIAAIPDPHLRGLFSHFTGNAATVGDDFLALLAAIDETLWSTDPLGDRGDHDLSVLIGRPLAVLRATMSLSLTGGPTGDQSWQFTPGVVPSPVTNGYENQRFAVRLGDADLHDDGLIGYYVNDDYSALNAVAATSSAYTKQVGPGNDLLIAPSAAGAVELTMIVDPRASVHAFSGILPVKEVAIPQSVIHSFTTSLQLSFRVGPLLTDDESVRIPAPAERHGTFDWRQQTSPGVWTADPVVAVTDAARLATSAPVIREGWLSLGGIGTADNTNAAS